MLISCPGDIKEEIQSIKDAVEQFNNTFSDVLGISIRVKHWSKNSYPQSGGKPQALLNKQFINDCDAAVAIMWTRFGTPTDEYGSGTEEEIEIMLESQKQVFIYFCDRPLKPSEMNSEEYQRVMGFRDKYKDRGIYSTYSSKEEFQKMFYAHLSQYFLSAKKVEEIQNAAHSNLVVKGIDKDQHISDNAMIKQFHIYGDYDKEGYIKKIKECYSEINAIETVRTENNPLLNGFLPTAKIDDHVKKCLIKVAEILKIELSDNFFDVGDLHEALGGLSFYSSVNGTKNEEHKFHLINKLYTTINEFLEWDSADEKLSKLKAISLVLSNNGTTYYEDVEISLTIPKSSFVTVDNFPELTDTDKNYLLNDKDLDDIFKIEPTSEYLDYDISVIHRQPNLPSMPSTSIGPYGLNYDYSAGFFDCLSDAFGYEVYSSGENYIVKVRFEYIKHNKSVAFPSVILFFNEISKIKYTITSKHCPEKIDGEIILVND